MHDFCGGQSQSKGGSQILNFKSKKKFFSFEDGSLVVFVFKNLIGWNTELNLYNYLVELVVFWDSKCILKFKMYFGIQNVL